MKFTIEQNVSKKNFKTEFFRNLEQRLIQKNLIDEQEVKLCRNSLFNEILIELNKFIVKSDADKKILITINK